MSKIIPYDVEPYLEHYGKKGMRWGYRKAQKARIGEQQKTLAKVTSGNASKGRKFATAMGHVPLKDLIAAKGSVTGGAKRVEARNQAQLDRLESGKLKVADYIQVYSNLPVARVRSSE